MGLGSSKDGEVREHEVAPGLDRLGLPHDGPALGALPKSRAKRSSILLSNRRPSAAGKIGSPVANVTLTSRPRKAQSASRQEAADPLNVLALAMRPAYNDGDVGVGDVDAFVEDARRDHGSQLPAPESLERRRSLATLEMSQVMGMTRCSRATA